MPLSQIVDQPVSLRLLRNMIKKRRVPNGLLFWGPEGVGKRTTAVAFTEALMCPEAPGEGCGECQTCRRIARRVHPDVFSIVPKGRSRSIRMDAVNMIQEFASFRPVEARQRVFLIEDADRMNLDAQNHFLKTLEEPLSHTIFILITTMPKRLLPTVRSRCQSVRFGLLTPQTIVRLLVEHYSAEAETAEAVAAAAQGQMSSAVALLETGKLQTVAEYCRRLNQGEDPFLLSAAFMEEIKKISQARVAEAESTLESTADSGGEEVESDEEEEAREAFLQGILRGEMAETLRLILGWYRDMAVYQQTRDQTSLLFRAYARELSKGGTVDFSATADAVEKAWRYIERNLNKDRVFRDLFFALAKA